MADKLTPKQARFVEEYLVDLNGTQAAIRAGYSADTANQQASQNLAKVNIQEAIAIGRAALSERTEITQDQVLRRWLAIGIADPNELIQNRRAPCRHCHGTDYGYQWKTPREFREAEAYAKSKDEPAPTDEGGYGYRTTNAINPECPECSGEGVGYVLAADTRTLSHAARILYAGAKQTRDGMEIKMHDQAKAMENVARHLGMFVEQKQMLGADGKPIDPAKAVIVFQVQK